MEVHETLEDLGVGGTSGDAALFYNFYKSNE